MTLDRVVQRFYSRPVAEHQQSLITGLKGSLKASAGFSNDFVRFLLKVLMYHNGGTQYALCLNYVSPQEPPIRRS